MTDLSHWDAAEAFSGKEAAALIVGVDPVNPLAEIWKCGPVLIRVTEGYRIGRTFASIWNLPEDFFDLRAQMPDALVSTFVAMFPVMQQSSGFIADSVFPNRVQGDEGEFYLQKFDRKELHRWINAVGIKSKYQFMRPLALPVEVDSAQSTATTSSEKWKLEARKIGVALRPKNTKLNQTQLAEKVHAELEKTTFKNRSGKTPTIESIVRHALQGI